MFSSFTINRSKHYNEYYAADEIHCDELTCSRLKEVFEYPEQEK